MQRVPFKKVGKRLLQVGLPLILAVIIFLYVKRDWSTLTSYHFTWNPWLLLASFGGFLLQELSYGLIWQLVLRRLGATLNFRLSLRIYLGSEFVRYIPGNVWHVLTRILWAGKYGVARPVAFASMVIELITKLAAGALVFACSLLFWGNTGAIHTLLQGTPVVLLLGIAMILALLVGLHPRVLGGALNFGLRLLKRTPITLQMRYLDILLVTLAWCISWCIAGSAFYLLLLALWPATPPVAWPICIGIYAIAWDIGFASFITPSGLGFREGAIVGLFALALPLPLGVSAILATLSRLVSTIAELVCVSAAYVSGGGQMREIQQEASTESKTEEKGTTMIPTSTAPTYLHVEGGARHE